MTPLLDTPHLKFAYTFVNVNKSWSTLTFLITRISGCYTPFILAPAEGVLEGWWLFLRGHLKVHGNIFIRSVSWRRVLLEFTRRKLRVPDITLGGQGHPKCHGWPFLTPRKVPWTLSIVILIKPTYVGVIPHFHNCAGLANPSCSCKVKYYNHIGLLYYYYYYSTTTTTRPLSIYSELSST